MPDKKRRWPVVVIVLSAVAVAAAVALVLVFVIFAPDTGKAKSYLKSGDTIMKGVNARADSLFEAMSGIQNSQPGSSAEAKSIADGIRSKSDEVSTAMYRARAEYKRVLTLSGVTDYADYAKLKIKAIDLFSKMFGDVNGFLGEMVRVMADAEAGLPVDTDAFTRRADQTAAEIQSILKQLQSVQSEGDKIKSKIQL